MQQMKGCGRRYKHACGEGIERERLATRQHKVAPDYDAIRRLHCTNFYC